MSMLRMILLMGGTFALSLWASARVQSTYATYRRVRARSIHLAHFCRVNPQDTRLKDKGGMDGRCRREMQHGRLDPNHFLLSVMKINVAKRLALACVVLSLYANGQAQESSGVLFNPRMLPQDREITVAAIVHYVIEQGIRLDFEDVEVLPENALTLSRVLELLEGKDMESLTRKESDLLESARKLKSKGAVGSFVLDYEEPRFKASQIGNEAMGIDQLLETLNRLAPGYSALDSNGSIILYWKDVKHPKVPELMMQDVSTAEAYGILAEKVLKPAGLLFVSMGPDPYYQDPAKRISINLQNVDLHIALTRFCQSLGPDVGWSISGAKSYRMISFYQLPELGR